MNSSNTYVEIGTHRRSNCKRNLNESFDTISPNNYSIIDTSSTDLKIKLRKSQKRLGLTVENFEESSSDECSDNSNSFDNNCNQKETTILEESLKYISLAERQKPVVFLDKLNKEKLESPMNKEKLTVVLENYNLQNIQSKNCKNKLFDDVTNSENLTITPEIHRDLILRRSSRSINRLSYAELISPEKSQKRNRIINTRTYSSRGKSLKSSKYSTPNTKSRSIVKDNLNQFENNVDKLPDNTTITAKRSSVKSRQHKSESECTSPSKRHRRVTYNESDSDDNSVSTEAIEFQTPKKVMPFKYCQSIEELTPSKSISRKLQNCITDKISDVRRISQVDNDLYTPQKTVIYRENMNGAENDISSKILKTPSKSEHPKIPKSTIKNTPSQKAKLIKQGLVTPSIQFRATPIKGDLTPLNKARTKLHVSFIPEALPCREKEYNDIYNFLEGKLLDGCGGCMYVSGVPGTGKTATVTDVIKKLEIRSERGILPDFKFININGMRLSEPRQSYVEIFRQLTGKTVSWEQAQSILDVQFTKSKKKPRPIILLVDELDILCTKRQDVVYNLLDWPTKASAQLIVITIANTMDLPERLLMGRVTSRLGLTRLTFQAYTHKQLQEIVTKRLLGTEAFNPDAVQLVARKVASVSGDARRALDICRRSAEIAELEGPNTLVTMIHVNEALNAMITQPKVRAIKHCSRLQQLVLQAIVAEVERTGVEETTFSDIYTMFESVAAIDGFQKVSCTLALAAVSKLGACRLILTDQKSNDFHQKLILNVSSDDIYYALRKD